MTEDSFDVLRLRSKKNYLRTKGEKMEEERQMGETMENWLRHVERNYLEGISKELDQAAT